jgi:hypothetical protein
MRLVSGMREELSESLDLCQLIVHGPALRHDSEKEYAADLLPLSMCRHCSQKRCALYRRVRTGLRSASLEARRFRMPSINHKHFYTNAKVDTTAGRVP